MTKPTKIRRRRIRKAEEEKEVSDPTNAQTLLLIEESGVLDFWSNPEEGGYDVDDCARFAMMVRHLRAVAETMLEEYYGERCPDFHTDCECCRRWKLLDELTANPFENSI